MTSPAIATELRLFAGRCIDVPALFVAGRQDWGVYQRPGDFERMQGRGCTDLHGCYLVEGAGLVFTLSHVDEQTPGEIAAATGMSPATVRVHLFRALRKLRGVLGEQV